MDNYIEIISDSKHCDVCGVLRHEIQIKRAYKLQAHHAVHYLEDLLRKQETGEVVTVDRETVLNLLCALLDIQDGIL